MKLLALIFVFITTVLLSFPVGSLSADCAAFREFTLFPNPVQVGRTVYIRAVAPLASLQEKVTNGTIKVSVSFNGEHALHLVDIPLCDSTPSIVCSSLGAGDNALNFDFEVPKIPIGSYSISVTTEIGSWGTICQDFTLNVTDPTQTENQYHSFIHAQLSGTAQFENSNVLHRAVGDAIQIGPIGYADPAYAVNYQWGSFSNIRGSEDVIVPRLSEVGYVWGISGNLTEIAYSATVRNHTYGGDFYVGYVTNATIKTTLDVKILEGRFELTWSYKQDGESTLTGAIHFDNEEGSLPPGWSYPTTIERFVTLSVTTDQNGVLLVSGRKSYCLTKDNCPPPAISDSQAGSKDPSGLSDNSIILIVCLVVGVTLLAVIIVVMALWMRRRRRFEEEDGIFSASRKPEYGNALVVDDIIQEAREHGASPIIPTLDRHPGDTESESDTSEDESELSPNNRRRSRFSREAGSPSNRRRTHSPSPRGERGRGGGRGRNGRSRSNSVDSMRRRSMSPPRRDDSSSYYSDAGSSASRDSSSDD